MNAAGDLLAGVLPPACLPEGLRPVEAVAAVAEVVGRHRDVEPFNAPPYTLATLEVGGPLAAQAVALLCFQGANAADALRERLTPSMGASVAPREVAALATLRRDLAVTADRFRELARSVAKITPADVAGHAE